MEKVRLKAPDGLELSVEVFHAEETKGLVQLIHGAKEHKRRYHTFIKFLNQQGLTVITSDNRGHGESVNAQYPLGFMNGADQMVSDQLIVTEHIKKLYPGKDLYLFGHSLGSLFARIYIQEHDHEIKKLVLSGMPNYVPGVSMGIALGKLFTALTGKHGYSRLLNHLTSSKISEFWISESITNLEAYRRDPFCQIAYHNSGALTIFEADSRMHDYERYLCKNPDLEILSVSGAGDPITGGELGLKDSILSLYKAGYRSIQNIVYDGMKHEVLNEDNNQIVYDDIVKFLFSKQRGAKGV